VDDCGLNKMKMTLDAQCKAIRLVCIYFP